MTTHAAVLSIGDELVLGQTVDTNSAYLSALLAQRGISTLMHMTIADDHEAIVEAFDAACKAAQLVLVSGGLGPTADDLTRFALAEVMGAELQLHEPSVAHIHGFFDRRGKQMPEKNKVQAMIPRGAEVLINDWGTAPGIHAQVQLADHTAQVYCMPGVPREMKAMFAHHVEPHLEAIAPSRKVILTTKINSFGMGESDGAERLGELMDRTRNPKVGTTVANGILSVRIRSEFADPQHAADQLEATAQEVEQRLGSCAYGRDDTTLPEAAVNLLREKGMTIATAESCTGGLIGKLITDVSGSSSVFRGGWVVYDDQMKVDRLSVSPETLSNHGAVSEEAARELAAGAMMRCPADLTLSVTGIAGPTGGTDTKPVGTIWLGMGIRRGERTFTRAILLRLGKDRDTNRDRSAKCALQLARLHALGEPLELLTWGEVLEEKPIELGV